jgi:hypothetical protein
MKATFSSALLLAVATTCAPAADAQAPWGGAEAPSAVVVRLYRDFAWEAVLAPRNDSLPFIEQPRPVLERYLEAGLAGLLLADRECVRRTKEICRINSHPLFDSQDPAATDLEVGAPDAGNIVRVRFRYPGSGARVEIRHVVEFTASGWRIRDIRYEEGASLRERLGDQR